MGRTASLPISVEQYGDASIMLTVDHADRGARAADVISMRERVLARRPYGVREIVSGLESLLVSFDPLVTAAEHVDYSLRLLAELPDASTTGDAEGPREFVVPVVFDDESGPDLADVAGECGVSTEVVVEHLLRSRLTISLLGAAMAPMMSGLDVVRPIRRQAQPRTNVPPGAIMVAGTNAIIQPFPGPTGWRVVGRTPLTIVDIRRADPVSFATGDTVRFERVAREDAGALDGGFLLPVSGAAESGRR